jgi:membrane protein DedA with SNARE-associated domain
MGTPALLETQPPAELSGLVGIAYRVIQSLGEWGVGALTFLETVVPPIPSEVVLPLAGFIARQGGLGLTLLLVTSTIGSYLGALTLYLLAARLGQERAIDVCARLPLVDRRDFERATEWFTDHGRRSIFFGRLVPGVRSLVSLPAGAVRMPLVRFSVFTVAGSALWNGLLIGLGWVLGSRYELVDQYSSVLDWVVRVAVVGLLGWLVVRRLRRGRAGSEQATGEHAARERH